MKPTFAACEYHLSAWRSRFSNWSTVASVTLRIPVRRLSSALTRGWGHPLRRTRSRASVALASRSRRLCSVRVPCVHLGPGSGQRRQFDEQVVVLLVGFLVVVW